MSKPFKSGIRIDPLYQSMQRLTGAINNHNKIVFCPTDLATSAIFHQILYCAGSIWFQGHKGISKTFSFILYILLSNYVVKFKVNNPQDPIARKMRIYKAVYWAM